MATKLMLVATMYTAFLGWAQAYPWAPSWRGGFLNIFGTNDEPMDDLEEPMIVEFDAEEPRQPRFPLNFFRPFPAYKPIRFPKMEFPKMPDFDRLPKGSHSSSSSSSSHSAFGGFQATGPDGTVSAASYGSSVQSKCSNGVCTATINGRTFRNTDGSYAQNMITDKCPPAFTAIQCNFVTGKDGCPIGKCHGYGTREACKAKSDCGTGASNCKNGICVYPEPEGKPLQVSIHGLRAPHPIAADSNELQLI